MSKLSPFLEGVFSAFVMTNQVPQPSYYTHSAKTDISKNNDTAQDWQAVGVDILTASKKVGDTIGMIRYEPKTT